MLRRLPIYVLALTTSTAAAQLTGVAHAATHKVVDVAHRGASAYAPENTLAAFRAAVSRRADFFELDVQETRDHRLVIMHDATLERTTNARTVYPRRAPWRVKDLTLAQIERLDAGSWFAPRFAGEKVPTLDRTLKAMDGAGLGLILELKNPYLYPGMNARVAAVLKAHPHWLRPGRLIVHSFDWNAAKAFHKLLPKVPIAVLGAPSAAQIPAVRKYAVQVDVPKAKATKAYVALLHRHHLKVYAWTVDSAATWRTLVKAGVDGIITDRPDVAVDR